MAKISVIGLGSFGTALAIHLYKCKHEVILYGRAEDDFVKIEKLRKNPFLPEITIPSDLKMTMDLKEATANEVLVLAVPTPYFRDVLTAIYQLPNNKDKKIISVAKGIEIKSGKRLSEVTLEVSRGNYQYCILSGPTHAEEISKGMPAAIVAASTNEDFRNLVQSYFNNDTLRVYTNNDVIGVEIGGALKNIVAISAGIVDGLGFGDNSKAALITRGLHEIIRFGVALGGDETTFRGLTGVGDLFVTCNSRHSRNRKYGELLGQGLSKDEIEKKLKMVAEGVFTAKAVYLMARDMQIDMPITKEIYQIIYEGKNPLESFKQLMIRETKKEMEEETV